MHLHDLLAGGNRHVRVSSGVKPARRMQGGDLRLGVELAAQQPARVTLLGASQHPHFAGLEDIGYVAEGIGASADRPAVLTASWVAPDGTVSRQTVVAAGVTCNLLLPSLLDLPDPFVRADLVIESDGGQPVFVGTSGVTPRQALYRLARGVGVEIGPGPKPQIHAGPDTVVTYVEEMPAEEWISRYRPDASEEAWSTPGYRIGKAHDLPVDDASLDFVFSSHVLEHLYNPLGHFDHWRRKLKPGGLVLAVVPAVCGTKDFVQPPTLLSALVDEHRAGVFDVPYATYVSWFAAGQPEHPQPEAAARKLYDERHSIHVHVYDHGSINALLRRCVQSHGYDSYRLLFKRNAKDFAFVLRADGGSETRA